MARFKFQPRWKEELVVSGEGGQFILELPMGILSAHLPTEATWKSKSPDWAKDHYSELRAELEEWCIRNNAKFVIDEAAGVEVNGKWL